MGREALGQEPPHSRMALPRARPNAPSPSPLLRAVRGSALYTEPQDPRRCRAQRLLCPAGWAGRSGKGPLFRGAPPAIRRAGQSLFQALRRGSRRSQLAPVAGALPALPGRRGSGVHYSPCAPPGPEPRTAGFEDGDANQLSKMVGCKLVVFCGFNCTFHRKCSFLHVDAC